MSETYYIRVRGRVQGPMDVDRLKELASKGQLSRSHELSVDSKNWNPAGNMTEVFERVRPSKPKEPEVESKAGGTMPPAPAGGIVPQGTANPYAPTGVGMAKEWHYTINGAQMGPVAASEIIELIRHKSLIRDDLVWKNGMPQWTPAAYLPEFVSAFSKPGKTFRFTEPGTSNRKSKMVAILLLLACGLLGAHAFYMGNTLRGILYLVAAVIYVTIQILIVSTTGQVNVPLSIAPWVIVAIAMILIAVKSDDSFQASCHQGWSL
jgi:TM2 domain-containing membrane protein YozV